MNPTPPEYLRPETCIRPLDTARIGDLGMWCKGDRRGEVL